MKSEAICSFMCLFYRGQPTLVDLHFFGQEINREFFLCYNFILAVNIPVRDG